MLKRREFIQAGGGMLAAGSAAAGERPPRPRERPLLVSVLTCPRPGGVSYVEGTLAAVDAELGGDVRRVLVCDGPAPAHPVGWTELLVPPREKVRAELPDNKAPGWVAMWAAYAQGADLLFLEDDIRPVRPGAFAAMAQHQVAAGCAFTSFYHRLRAPGIHDAAAFNMSQAVLIPWFRLVALWSQRNNLSTVVGVDLGIAEVGRRAGWRFEQTAPLIAHVGTLSAAMPGHVWR